MRLPVDEAGADWVSEANTIGTVRVTFSNGPRVDAPVANDIGR
jgi:hypothetical protein